MSTLYHLKGIYVKSEKHNINVVGADGPVRPAEGSKKLLKSIAKEKQII